MATPKIGLNKIKRKNGFVYQIDYTIDGRRIREVIGKNKREAELVQSKIQTDLLYGKYELPSQKKSVPLKQVIEEFLRIKSNSARESSLTRYREYFHQFTYFLTKHFPATINNVSSIKTDYIIESIEHLTTKGTDKGRVWAPATANGYRIQLASLFKYSIYKEYIKKNPVSVISPKQIEEKVKIKFYSPEEIQKIYDIAEEKWIRFYKFILQTGIRSGEIINLLWENVDLNPESAKIIIKSGERWKTKTGKARVIPLNKTALDILKMQENNKSEYVFPDVNGDRYQENKPRRELQKKLIKIGIWGDIHQFRHTFGTIYMSSKAGTLFDLQKLMGHADPKTTMIYVHLSEKYLRETLFKLD